MTHPRRRRMPLFAAVTAASLTAALGLSACHAWTTGSQASTAQSSQTTAATTSTTVPATTVPSTTTTVPVTTTTVPVTTTTVPAASGILHVGSSGPAVLQLQESLTALGYWLGPPDGHFGGTTQQAVWALQKAAGLTRTGTLNAATAAALAAGTKPTAMSTSGHIIEVNLATDLVLIVDNGQVTTILNTSTGGHYVYYLSGHRQVAITPTGHFTTYREVNGTDISPLGTLWRPKFFVGGFAIHGDGYVPAYPVSHGCVRVSDAAIDWIWSSGVDPIGTSVWIY